MDWLNAVAFDSNLRYDWLQLDSNPEPLSS